MKRIGVIGIGNVLMGDDAFGPHVISALQAGYEFPANVEVRDMGTPGLDLTAYLTGLGALILVDTVKAAGPPGALRLYTRAEILRHAPQPRLSPHDPSLKEALLMADLAGGGPRDVLLVGAVPASVATGVGLGPAVRAAIPGAVSAVLAELDRIGSSARALDHPRRADLWWERAPEPAPPHAGG
jgi:hydrogenase maturation protease